jgi:alkanesulfonate monooxygenase SsuD/methylene tetrahydromethanopterin reductase-like flavin-dependent oxidoreductase (luciferase family)
MMDGSTPRWTDVLALARRAEDAGFDGVTLGEHFLARFGGTTLGGWDSGSLLAALAAATRRVTLEFLVTCTSFRNPALVAKIADTVDEISGGRLVLGLGAGWLEAEFTAFGFPFDHRVSRFSEAIAIIHGLLRSGRMDFAGRYYEVRDCELRPRGPRPEGPQILIGTNGSRMMHLTARYADVWDTNFRPPAELPALQTALDEACASEGRDPATLTRSASITVGLNGASNPYGLPTHLTGSPSELAAGLRAYADAGFSQVVVWIAPTTLAGIDTFAPVLNLLHQGDHR